MSKWHKLLMGCAVIVFNSQLLAEVWTVNDVEDIQASLTRMKSSVAPQYYSSSAMLETLNFNNGLLLQPPYHEFAVVISNHFPAAMLHLGELTTNALDRLAIIGTGRVFDENCYVDYLDCLVTQCTNGCVSRAELEWFEATSRHDQMSVLIRRYREGKIASLIQRLSVLQPASNYWADVLSGVAYTNYLEEVDAGLWGDNPLR